MQAIKKGFTLVELLVVISVISILASISFIAYQQFNVSAKDSSRQSQATSLSKALDKYYQANGSYPNCNALSGDPATIISTLGLTGLKPSVFKAPDDSVSNSIQCGGSSATNKFVYNGDGTTECSNNTSSCRSFTLQYKLEGSGNTTTITGQFSAPISSSTIVTLNQPSQGTGCTVTDFTSLSLSWSISGSTSGVTAFEIQTSTENTFTSGLVSISGSTSVYVTNPATTSYAYAVNSFTPGTTYYFRVRAVSGTSPNYSPYSFWSSIKSQSPRNDALTLSINPSAATSTSVSISSWGTNACAAQYVLFRSTSSSMTSPATTNYATTTTFPVTVSGLTASTTYYFKIKFNVVLGGGSGYVSRLTPLANISGTTSAGGGLQGAPTCSLGRTGLSSASKGSLTWSAVTGATNYTVQFLKSDGTDFDGPYTTTTLSQVSNVLSGGSWYATVNANNSATCTSNTITSLTP